MAETTQAPMTSIRSRIAALNLEEVHAPSPGAKPTYNYDQTTAKKKAPPPPPPTKRPQVQQRLQTINNPPVLSNSTLSMRQPGNLPRGPSPAPPTPQPELPPRLPPRTQSQEVPPSLPPRRPSEQSIKRRESSESVCTITSNGSARTATSVASNGAPLYHIRAPPFDPTKVPPVFPRRTPAEPIESATRKAMKSNINTIPDRAAPPVLPARPALPARNVSQPQERTKRGEILPPPAPRRSALSFGLNKATEVPPPVPTNRPNASPPPVPLASRPNLDAIMASKPKPGATPVSCLVCRDFSAPDHHATKFPRLSLPGCDMGWLAQQLTAPFPSLTDKARAIFTWLHHNIDYDTHSFFGGTVQSTDQSAGNVLQTGLAVCAGYAGLFAAIALKAGLNAVVVGGHGKGYGHTDLKPGAPLPPRESDNHAWNAVQIDNGQWKLIDCCWGAGYSNGPHEGYKRKFSPERFTQDNDEFGLDHYPSDNAYFFRSDGRASITWEEYMGADGVGERVFTCSTGCQLNGLGRRTFQPVSKYIRVYDPAGSPVIRFQFGTACAHWDHERNGEGKPMVQVLNIGGRDGRKTEMIPFQTDGRVWWLDVNRADLGAPGQKVNVFAIISFDNKDGRGLTIEQFKAKKGRCAMAWQSVAHWELI